MNRVVPQIYKSTNKPVTSVIRQLYKEKKIVLQNTAKVSEYPSKKLEKNQPERII